MKIAFDAKRALNNGTGLGNYSRDLMNALFRLFPENEYYLYTPSAKDEFLNQLHGDFKLRFPEDFNRNLPSSIWRSYGIMKDVWKDKANIYHGLSNELPLRTKSLVRTVVTIHDVIFLKHKEQYPFLDRRVYDYKTRKAIEYADRIIAVSEETKRDLVEFYKAETKKIEVIYQGINERFYVVDPQDSEVIKKYALPQKYILNVGSFFSRKNHKTLIEAFARITDKVQEDLVLVGSGGNRREEIEQLIQQKKLADRVKILSNVANYDLPAIYRAATLFVFPSLMEGFGIPVLEAQASKVPVITTGGGAMEEAGGKDAVYIKPTDAEEIAAAMLKVLGDETLRNNMVKNAYHHALVINNKRSAEQTMTIYRELAAK